MELPASIAASAALARQNMTMSVIKQNAEQGKAIANIIENSIISTPVNGTRGVSVNFSV